LLLAWLCLPILLAPKGLLLALCLCEVALSLPQDCCTTQEPRTCCDSEESADPARLQASCEHCYEVTGPDGIAARLAEGQTAEAIVPMVQGLALCPPRLPGISLAPRSPDTDHSPPRGAILPLRI
jgi:hypothetical protein